MTQKNLVLVTGANGHLGNNLVRLLISKGYQVRASVRNIKNTKPFEGLDCEVVEADITDKNSMLHALRGVETFYAVGAVFKLWAKDPQKEIYDVNIDGCKIMIESAAETGVKRIVYVSSIAALDYTKGTPISEESGYNPDRRDMYYNSKNDGEKLAFELSKKHNIELVAVLPSAMIGGVIADRLSNSNEILKAILNNKLPIETKITLNWIDVNDVAEGCILAANKGQSGERYILANEKCMTITDSIKLANDLFPKLKLKKPIPVPKFVLFAFGALLGLGAKITGKSPAMTTKEVNMFYGLIQNFDISKARKVLGFNPKPSRQALESALLYMWEEKERLLK
ncbi:NAD-dependent epimerase/dehydratase family protein [Dysgonomonas sp. BGC7]|uniref:NAD-dependent epimerase/dehydratase family protein n=1 Tax=Dysgonomonas sp. BGC7 TaxID=1658008 RepID=UPI00067FC650|nr:NAD-dependent epimerase/dehydratase family protein [Dysgonomonas sp. BGC7]MBD8387235.1 NAD-dependent epimerase/dehydratase family protein [Dysgonomonas sp. BGC7]